MNRARLYSSPSLSSVARGEFLQAANLHQGEIQGMGADVAEEDREEVREDLVDALLSLATSTAGLATIATTLDESGRLFGLASQVIDQALTAAGEKGRPEVLITAGQILVKLAEHEQRLTGNVNNQTFDAACARFTEALASEHVSPVEGLCERGDALHAHATALMELATGGRVTGEGDLAQLQQLVVGRLEQARKDYETALQLEPDTPSIFSKLGDTLVLRWKAASPAERGDPALAQKAIEAYMRSMNVPFKRNEDPDTLYGLAVIHTLTGDTERARQWLLQWKSKGGQGAEVLRDPDFAPLHAQEWFAKAFGSV